MFTGLIQDLGRLEQSEKMDGANLQYSIFTQLSPELFQIGRSIAVDGVCLTVEAWDPKLQIFQVTLVPETLQRTRFGSLPVGSFLNLEAPMTLNSFVDGHLVSGHVDATVEVEQAPPTLILRLPDEYLKFAALKGSMAVNGVSLTIAEVKGNEISFALIPETLRLTNLAHLQKGDIVHIEVDLLARYLERLAQFS